MSKFTKLPRWMGWMTAAVCLVLAIAVVLMIRLWSQDAPREEAPAVTDTTTAAADIEESTTAPSAEETVIESDSTTDSRPTDEGGSTTVETATDVVTTTDGVTSVATTTTADGGIFTVVTTTAEGLTPTTATTDSRTSTAAATVVPTATVSVPVTATTATTTAKSSRHSTGTVTTATVGKVTVATTTKTTVQTTTATTKTTAPVTATTRTTTAVTKITTPSTTASTAPPLSKEKQRYLSLMDSENSWLATCQLSNGAIAMTPTRNGVVKVNPYFADIAALSLLNQPEKYATKVKRYMDWHFAHLNTVQTDPNGVDGTIFDWRYTVSSGTVVLEEWLTAVPSYDSTDSYAATFLMVVDKYVRQTGDTAYAVKHAPKLRRVVNALFATMDNGLTMATPRSPVKLLMDNCEVYGGLQAAAQLYRDVLIPAGAASAAEAEHLEQAARDVSTHMENEMWTGTYYRPSITQTGEPYHDFSWKDYYPCATAQTFPILYGLLDPASERAGKLYEQFCWRFDWENLNHPDDYMWGSNAYTAALMGDTLRVETYLTAYEQRVSASREYPLYNGDAAWVAMTAYYMSEKID